VAAVEDRDRLGQDRRARAREARQAKLAALEAGDRGELALGLFEPRDCRFGVRGQYAPGVGELRPLAGPVEELHPDLTLERRDLLADRRLRHEQAVGGGRERPSLGDLTEDPKPLHIEH
jgi:hypothetical protein